ncbi:hypothetical protein [Pedobacter steynii]|uniref:Uncharacterized protein n=1 Tax=Pedobacter steynii TaxID=430522 RepID=A0A1D7QMX4_9SPHI|nr:hypothetical protein [Pedobacter steynii]AOM80011.1 hypothetical protein BFS30_24330 [Pedobacter steynii]
MLYKEIPVASNGEVRYFNFDTAKNEFGQVGKVWSENMTLEVDQHFAAIDGNMSEKWIPPVIKKLRQILGYEKEYDHFWRSK